MKLLVNPKYRSIYRILITVMTFVMLSLTSAGQNRTITYTSSGNFTVPAGITSITVECWGAGGAGGGSTSENSGGSGGGGGGYTLGTLTVTPGQVINFTVGTGGTGVTGGNGNSGTATTFLTLTANGGTGGESNKGAVGTGGTATGGTTNINGNNGQTGTSIGGNGGNGANGGTGGLGVTNNNGENGNPPGGGGGGGERSGGTSMAGGNGATGQLTIFWTICTPVMGYNYERNITIDHNYVSGSEDLYNFPMLVNLAGQTFLKNLPNGQVENTNGYDIIFTDENYNILDHQIEYYNGSNGDLIAWVRIPVLSSSANTVIKILYGNTQISSDPSTTDVWDSHYKGVWHMNNSSLQDATVFNKSGTPFNNPSYTGGIIDNSMLMNGSNQYAGVQNDPNINFNGNITVSAWVYMNNRNRDQKIAGNQNNSSGGYKFGIYTNNKVEFEIRNSSNVPSLNRNVTGGTVLSTGQWYYLAGISSDVLDSIMTFVNGVPERPFKKTGTLGTASNTLSIGKEPFQSSYYFSGMFDELRISDEVRSDGWMRTEYYNQSSPSTFYSIDATATESNNLPSESLCSGPVTLTFGYPAGGTYSGNAYISGDIFTPPSAGTYPITYTYDGGCGPMGVTKDIIITDAPAAPVASNMVYCTGQIAWLQATGENIRWYSGGTLVSTANPFSTGQTVPGTYDYTVTQTINGCESPETDVTLTILTGTTINTQPSPVTICEGGDATFTISATGYNLSYQWQEDGVDITDGGIYSGATTSALMLTDPGLTKDGKQYQCIITSTCGTSQVTSNPALLTVNPVPVATFSYLGSPYCPNAADPLPTFSGGGVAGTFSSTAGLVFVNTSTGEVDLSASTPGIYTVTNTIAAAGGCNEVIATNPIEIISTFTWTGSTNTDWNDTGNWSCGILPNGNTSVVVTSTGNDPVLSTGAAGNVNNITIDPGASLTVSGNTIYIGGTITNNGTFTSTGGSVEMNGTSLQVIGTGSFAGNTIKDLIVNNPAGVSLTGPLNVTGIVTLQNGDLTSDGNLTLISSVTQTALISGSGTGNVTGNATMQRYLPSGFGYKYFSSPVQSATVNEFSDDMTLSDFTFYSYDENRTGSGWLTYNTATNPLVPLEGYAVNFGSVSDPNTVDISGTVNNGSLSTTLYNHNYTYTQGFNLVGNPYPSPIDWDAATGWTKTNIDNAIYFFTASTTDQYGGTYSSYINGISSDGTASNIIPSMQGFFIHVSDGSYPVTATLGMDNNVRITDFAHPFFKSLQVSRPPVMRLTAGFSDDVHSSDPLVIYFDENATLAFNKQLEALKLLNTDYSVANLYAINQDGIKLSVDALPAIADDSTAIPLGLKINRAGDIVFRIKDLDPALADRKIILTDLVAGKDQDLVPDAQYVVNLGAGEYNNRFVLNITSIATRTTDYNETNDIFSVYCSHGVLRSTINIVYGSEGIVSLYNLTGQVMFSRKVYDKGYYEFSPGVKDGIYIVTYISGTERISKKIYIHNR